MAILRPKILVVDDEPDLEHLVRQRMRREIRSGQYSFMFAQNGVEALEVLSEEQDIDMVLSDINMPRMDGLTLLEQIPKVDPNIRSVIVSAYGDMKNIRTAMNRGAFDFITKPIDFEDMKVTIQRTLHHLELWREALESRDKLVALQNELSVANKMQQSILPTSFPTGSGFEIFGSMKPARDVGGDFFDVLSLEDGRIGLVVADVSDHWPRFTGQGVERSKSTVARRKRRRHVRDRLLRDLRPRNRRVRLCQWRAQYPARGPHRRQLDRDSADRRSSTRRGTRFCLRGKLDIPATWRPRRLVHRRRHRGRKRPRRPVRARAPVRGFHQRDTYGRPRYQRGGFCGGRGLCRRCPAI
ncbi:MAG: response regulator [Gemmatimonadetes bacterium]|nr:response regulator [Gemmatimonadota bacterium]